jgi:predicted DNA-binding transcriptional regulator YafY
MTRVQDGAQTRMIQLIIDLFEARDLIPFGKYEDEAIWGNERTFRRMKGKLNEVWELRRSSPLFEIVDSSGNPTTRGDRYLKLVDKGLKTGRIEQMSVLPAFMQLLSLVKGTILEETFEPRYREFRESLNRTERNYFDRTKRKFFHVGKGQKSYEEKGDVLDDIYDALIREHMLEVKYQAKTGRLIEGKIIPLTLVMFNNGLFLLLKFSDESKDGKIYTWALDNFIEVTPRLKEKFKYPLDFFPEKLFEGSFGLIHGAEEELTDVVLEYSSDSWVDEYLKQRKWTGNEEYKEVKGAKTRFSMKVRDLREVKTWLFGIATEVEVIKPKKLKKYLIDDVKKILEKNKI